MRVLLASTPGAGHLGPLFPYAHAIRRAGHEVVVASAAAGRGVVERAGLDHHEIPGPPEAELGALMGSVGSLTPDEANVRVIGELFARLRARAALPGMLAAIEDWRPDVVMRESCEFSSPVAAELLGVPLARAAIGLAWTEEWCLGIAAPGVDELRAHVGLPADPEGTRMHDSPYFTLTPPSLEESWSPGPRWTRRFRDTAFAPRVEQDGMIAPMVYVTFGSVAPRMGFFPGLYRAVIDALADLPIDLIVTVGDTADPAELGPLPENVRAERWIPQAELLPRAAVMVCHGGFGTTLGGLSAGVPLAVMPLFADQPYNAERVADLGAGVSIDPAEPGKVRGAVLRLLADPTHRVAAGRIAGDVHALPPVDAAVPALMEVAALGEELAA